MSLPPEATLPAGLAATYLVGEVLGRGATSTVYAARALDGRQGALKVMVQPHAALLQLEREALRHGQLTHPHLARVYAAGIAQGSPMVAYTFMERLRGPRLVELLAAGPLPWRDAARIAMELATGLAAMHAHGLIHRDVKPGNVCDADRGAVLMDFGSLARIGHEVVANGAGTPAYMAPEQAFATQLTPAVDVYGLGCVLFEMLCGHAPYAGGGLAVLVHHAHDALPAHLLADKAPASLVALVAACCAKRPADRPDVGAVAQAIAEVLRTRAQAPLRRRAQRAAGGLASAGLAAGVVMQLFAPAAGVAAELGASEAWHGVLVDAMVPPRTVMVAGDDLHLSLTATGRQLDVSITDEDGNAVALDEIVVRVTKDDAMALVFTATAVAPGRWQLTTPTTLRELAVGIYLPDRDALVKARF